MENAPACDCEVEVAGMVTCVDVGIRVLVGAAQLTIKENPNVKRTME